MAEIQRDLFGNEIEPEFDNLRVELELIEGNTFESRLKRFKYLDSLRSPYTCEYGCSDIGMVGNTEANLLYEEAGLAFINGTFIATILLCQAFIEHWLTEYISRKRNLAEIPKSLEGMLKLCRKEGLMHIYLVEKINNVRLVRNPFTHPKPYEYPHSISQRLLEMKTNPKTKMHAEDLLEQDAKNAIDIMHTILET